MEISIKGPGIDTVFQKFLEVSGFSNCASKEVDFSLNANSLKNVEVHWLMFRLCISCNLWLQKLKWHKSMKVSLMLVITSDALDVTYGPRLAGSVV